MEPSILVTDSGAQLRWQESGLLAVCEVGVEDILGVEVDDHALVVHHYPPVEASWGCCGAGEGGDRQLELLRVACSSSAAATDLANAFWARVSGRPKRLAVFINPAGGVGRALQAYTRDVEPLVRAASAVATVTVTRHQGHALELASELDPQQYDAVVVVSGDGLACEVYNGLRANPAPAASALPFAIIPAGSGNALARSMAALAKESNTCRNAALAMLTCDRPRALDAAEVLQMGLQRPLHALLSLSWALVADIDIESEALRCLGGSRFTVQALVRCAALRRYNGSLVFRSPVGAPMLGDRPATEGEFAAAVRLGVADSDDLGCWHALDGPFDSFWALNVPWGGETALAAPNAVLDDGAFDLVVVRGGSAMDVAAVLLAFDDGSHVKHSCVTIVKASAFVLTPGAPVGGGGAGVLVLDGEKVAASSVDAKEAALPLLYTPVAMRVHPGAARILARNTR